MSKTRRVLKRKKKNNKSKTFKKLQCSPTNREKKYTCFDDEDLHKMRDIWNARHLDKTITTNASKKI